MIVSYEYSIRVTVVFQISTNKGSASVDKGASPTGGDVLKKMARYVLDTLPFFQEPKI